MKKTILILSAVLALCALPRHAGALPSSDEVLCMVISHSDGTEATFALCDKPVVSHQNGNLVVESSTGSMSTPLSDIAQWTFALSNINSIEETPMANPQALYRFGQATISGLPAGTRVGVYGIDGKALMQAVSDGEGHVSIDLGQLPNGVYILRTPHQSYKIKK